MHWLLSGALLQTSAAGIDEPTHQNAGMNLPQHKGFLSGFQIPRLEKLIGLTQSVAVAAERSHTTQSPHHC